MKNRKINIGFIILILILIVSLISNMKQFSHKKHMHEVIVNNLYYNLVDISSNLEPIIDEVDFELMLSDTEESVLHHLSNDFIKLHTLLNYYSINFNGYGSNSIIDFEFISRTLSLGYGTVNGLTYNGILVDNKISANEYEYLKILKNDIDIILVSMRSDENPLQENKNLNSNEINKIFSLFFNSWSYRNEYSPFHLISQ